MNIVAIDPGDVQSAYFADGVNGFKFGKVENWKLRGMISSGDFGFGDTRYTIEMIASYGMPVGETVFKTCLYIGRLIELIEDRTDIKPVLIYRKDVKMHLCGTMRAKDGNIRQALIDRYGEPGTKKNPGVLYGVSKDMWSALAIYTFVKDTL